MERLYLINESSVKEIKANKDFEEFWLYIYYKENKIYKCQFDELILLDCEISVLTDDNSKIKYWQNEIKDFYQKFPVRSD